MRKFFRIALLFGCLAWAVTSCRELNPFFEEEVVAKVGEKKLLLSEVQSIFKSELTPEDSLKLYDQYVNSWIKRQLKIQQAEQLFPEAIPEIERMVEDYRSSLLTHRLDQFHVDAKIDTALTDQEVAEYYNAHLADFTLDRAIVKGVIVTLPHNHRQKAKVKELMAQTGDKYQDFLELSRKNGFKVQEVVSWLDFADFLNMLPTNKLRDYDELLTNTGVQEMRDGDDLYLVLITDKLKQGDTAPIERVSETIRRVLFNMRRQDIIRAYEDSIVNAATLNQLYEINSKQNR